MAVIKYNGGDLLPERRGVIGAVFNSLNGDHTFSSRVVRRRKLGRFTKPSFLILILLLFALFLISLSVFGLRLQLPGNFESLEKLDNADNFEESNQIRNEVKQEFHGSNYILNPPKSKRKQLEVWDWLM
ncbi:conserved hypothetical protein [Ricinus communis]|uniref:Uncharacterized protein n=1 Tax=Ricinus communis TaxID=3988 RepID=B9S8V0_RICCO|nr:conserved hypothetical protein [Ricinus communis]